MQTCPECGAEMAKGLSMHIRFKHPSSPEVEERMDSDVAVLPPGQTRSRRAARKYANAVPTPLDQIRTQPGGVTGAWAYYLDTRPDIGATIRDILHLSPNGGVPDSADPKMRARYGANADYYRAMQLRKGFKFIGSKLTQEGVRELVSIMDRNRQEEINFMLDEIDDADRQLSAGLKPEWYHVLRQRKAKASARIEMLQQQWDPVALVAELDEISRAQRMAALDPNVLAVMREMVGEVNAKFADAVQHFARGKAKEDPELVGTAIRGGGGGGSEFATGRDFIDVG